MIKTLVPMRTALADRRYFGEQLAEASWDSWKVLLLAIAGEQLTTDELTAFRGLANRLKPPTEPIREFWACCGRRSGKSRSAAILACWLACCRDNRAVLGPGERGQVQVLATTRDVAANLFNFVCGAIESSRALRGLIDGKTADVLSLKTGVDIAVRSASNRSTRGSTAVAILCDEISTWRSDTSTCPDSEVLRAVKPGLLTTGGPLIAISSPYGRSGELYKSYVKHWGKESARVLCVQAETTVLNPLADRDEIAAAYEDDPIGAASEYGATFMSSVESFVSQEVVDAAVVIGRYEIPPQANVEFSAFADMSGGSVESAACAVAFRNHDGVATLAAVREARAPHSPAAVIEQFAEFLRSYGCSRCVGDAYGGLFPVEKFREHGIAYEQTKKAKSDYYRDLLPLMNSGKVELLDNARLVGQLLNLERRAVRGRDIIDHPKIPGMHDDLINAAAGALTTVSYETAPNWSRFENFLHKGEPVEEPALHYFSFVSMAADVDGKAAVIGWKVNQHLNPALVLCDFRTGFFSDKIFADYSDFLSVCYRSCSTGTKTCAIVPIYYLPSEKDVIRTFEFAPKVSALVAAGKVRLSKVAHEQSRTAPLCSALDFRIEKLSDPLAAASLAGICLGLLGNPSDLM